MPEAADTDEVERQLLVARLRQEVTASWLRQHDLRAVFGVLSALQQHDPNGIGGAQLAIIVRRLMASEVRPGGPYYSTGKQIDPLANRYIQRFFSQRGIVLPGITAYLANVPKNGRCPEHPQGSLLAQAHRLRTLCRRRSATTPPAAKSHFQHRVMQAVDSHISALPAELQITGQRVWDDFQNSSTIDEIILLPRQFSHSLRQPTAVTDRCLMQLSIANTFGWMATVLYDDFIDEEGRPALLPFAHAADSIAITAYRLAIAGQLEHIQRIEHWTMLVDAANAWEVAHTRAHVSTERITFAQLPRYGRRLVLADRAFGHTIGAMLVALCQPGGSPDQTEAVYDAWRHYLIARQLNDDLHDWRKDLRAGHLNAVLTSMLQQIGVGQGEYDLDTLTSQLESHFLQTGLADVSRRILRHASNCRRLFDSSQLLQAEAPVLAYIAKLEDTARQAMQLQHHGQSFLREYQ